MMNQIFIPESPKNSSFIELPEDIAFAEIFPNTLKHMEIHDEIEENILYCLNKQKPKKELIQRSESKNSINEKELIFDDYETFYNYFADIKENNDIALENDDYKDHCVMNYDDKQKLVYSIIEDENLIKVEEECLNFKKKAKEKIYGIIKEEKIEKYEKNKKDIETKSSQVIHKKNRRQRKKKTQIDTTEKCFPFKTGKGMIYSLVQYDESLSPRIDNLNSIYIHSQDISISSKQEYNLSNKKYDEQIKNAGENKEEYKKEKSKEEICKYKEQINCLNDNFIFKFKTKKYYIGDNGKKKRVRKKRKFKPDDIRKKIKARFHKALKNIINDNLKKAGSKELFDFFPQCFIANVSKKVNAKYFQFTYKELLSTNFIVELNKEEYRNNVIDTNKYKKNIKVLNYLENNPDICKRSGFDLIKDKKYKDILNIYFTSAEFENSLFILKKENESSEYIQEYINKAKNYVNFYSNVKIKDYEKDLDNDEENEEDSKDN